jgi:hypothetical protein
MKWSWVQGSHNPRLAHLLEIWNRQNEEFLGTSLFAFNFIWINVDPKLFVISMMRQNFCLCLKKKAICVLLRMDNHTWTKFLLLEQNFLKRIWEIYTDCCCCVLVRAKYFSI